MGKIPADVGAGLANVELIYTGHPLISGLQPQAQRTYSSRSLKCLCGKYSDYRGTLG